MITRQLSAAVFVVVLTLISIQSFAEEPRNGGFGSWRVGIYHGVCELRATGNIGPRESDREFHIDTLGHASGIGVEVIFLIAPIDGYGWASFEFVARQLYLGFRIVDFSDEQDVWFQSIDRINASGFDMVRFESPGEDAVESPWYGLATDAATTVLAKAIDGERQAFVLYNDDIVEAIVELDIPTRHSAGALEEFRVAAKMHRLCGDEYQPVIEKKDGY
ncbi:MAG: hypothetical protein AAGH76_15165 [Pseudomonadota bacterium]